ncbi:MAG: hypothetical protein NUW01_00070 [Gemmatimonadaceae bacterium]|nr:hypothetical protein [Gemmatimonadaceae bacterium]
MSDTIAFLCPLPPPELHSNPKTWRTDRSGKKRRVPPHWTEKVKAKQAYSERVYVQWAVHSAIHAAETHGELFGVPWKRARIIYEWRYCGNAPDEQNLGANLKALTDILCMAPNNGLQTNNTTYLGLVEDDKGLEPEYRLTRVAHRTDEGVYVTLVRL